MRQAIVITLSLINYDVLIRWEFFYLLTEIFLFNSVLIALYLASSKKRFF